MEIGDPKAMKALAHPLRLDLIELLGEIGPATAARCGRILDVSQASCSFHLRQLARYGFVEDAGQGSDRRERLWRLVDRRFRFAPGLDLDPVVTQQLSQVLARREIERVLEYLERRPGEPEEWRRADVLTTAKLPLSAADLADITTKWSELLAPYLAKAEANDAQLQPGQRHVRFFLAASPLPDLDLGDSEVETDS
ncbi:DNA-binding transcriptional ArsR family regulator [Streptacidiphilus sp. MAP12-16]